MSSDVRVRFAPSPTGYLHVGGARTALFNWLFARNQGGRFILRIEDTDMERSTEESYRAIVEDMRWLGLDWDEGPGAGGDYGPYFQSERRSIYSEWCGRLVSEGKAYRCFCSQEELKRMREELRKLGKDIKYDRRCRDLSPEEVQKRISAGKGFVVRFKTPLSGQTIVEDVVKGNITFENSTLDDFILLKSDGYPTYNFACVIDDMLMKISHVIRGDDHLSNTPKQIQIYKALGAAPPIFAHVPMIMGPDRTRLSKRHGATSVGQFREDGYLPEAMVNYLALLGWSFDDATTIFERNELIAKFSLEKVSSTPAVFDYAKLQWLNGEYMKRKAISERAELVTPHLLQAGLIEEPLTAETKAYIEKVVDVVGERLKVGRQIVDLADFFFKDEISYGEEVSGFLKQHYVPAVLSLLEDRLGKLENFVAPSIESVMRGLVSEMGLKTGHLFQPVRIALTGKKHSPDLLKIMEALGKERVIARLRVARKKALESM